MIRPTALLAFSLLALVPAAAGAARWSEPEIAGIVTDAAIAEISGMAASRTRPGAYWAVNDGGNGAVLQLMDGRGRHLSSVAVPWNSPTRT